MWLLRKIRENRRFAELEERIEKLERGHRALDMEWSEHYDKIRHMFGRMAKRSAIIEKANEAEEAQQEAGEPPDESPLLDGLSARQRLLQAQILASRRH